MTWRAIVISKCTFISIVWNGFMETWDGKNGSTLFGMLRREYKDAESFILQSISQTTGESSRLHIFCNCWCVRCQNIQSLILQLRMTLVKKKSICTCHRVMLEAANLHSETLWNCEAIPSVISWISFLKSPKAFAASDQRCPSCLTSKNDGDFILNNQTETKDSYWHPAVLCKIVTVMCLMCNSWRCVPIPAATKQN